MTILDKVKITTNYFNFILDTCFSMDGCVVTDSRTLCLRLIRHRRHSQLTLRLSYLMSVKSDAPPLLLSPSLFQEIQSLLTNWKGPDLIGYGELVLEGTFRIQRAKNERTLFLFDKILLITKKREETYTYKAHILVRVHTPTCFQFWTIRSSWCFKHGSFIFCWLLDFSKVVYQVTLVLTSWS